MSSWPCQMSQVCSARPSAQRTITTNHWRGNSHVTIVYYCRKNNWNNNVVASRCSIACRSIIRYNPGKKLLHFYNVRSASAAFFVVVLYVFVACRVRKQVCCSETSTSAILSPPLVVCLLLIQRCLLAFSLH